MNVAETLLFLFAILVGFCLVKRQEHIEYLNKVKEIEDFKLDCVHHGNKNILKDMGEEKFIKYFGNDQLNQIKNGTDTKIVEMIKQKEVRRYEYN